MNKSAWIMNTPESCSDCGFSGSDVEFCIALNERIPEEVYLHNKILKACPLKKIPEKWSATELEGMQEYAQARAEGYNDCIDSILG